MHQTSRGFQKAIFVFDYSVINFGGIKCAGCPGFIPAQSYTPVFKLINPLSIGNTGLFIICGIKSIIFFFVGAYIKY